MEPNSTTEDRTELQNVEADDPKTDTDSEDSGEYDSTAEDIEDLDDATTAGTIIHSTSISHIDRAGGKPRRTQARARKRAEWQPTTADRKSKAREYEQDMMNRLHAAQRHLRDKGDTPITTMIANVNGLQAKMKDRPGVKRLEALLDQCQAIGATQILITEGHHKDRSSEAQVRDTIEQKLKGRWAVHITPCRMFAGRSYSSTAVAIKCEHQEQAQRIFCSGYISISGAPIPGTIENDRLFEMDMPIPATKQILKTLAGAFVTTRRRQLQSRITGKTTTIADGCGHSARLRAFVHAQGELEGRMTVALRPHEDDDAHIDVVVYGVNQQSDGKRHLSALKLTHSIVRCREWAARNLPQ